MKKARINISLMKYTEEVIREMKCMRMIMDRMCEQKMMRNMDQMMSKMQERDEMMTSMMNMTVNMKENC